MKISLTIFFLLISSLLYSQKRDQARISSLNKALTEAKQDTVRVNILNNLSQAYVRINPDEGIRYANSALFLAQSLKWKKGIRNAYESLGDNYGKKEQVNRIIEYYNLAIAISEELNDKDKIAHELHDIGYSYYDKSDYANALDYLLKSLKISEEIKNRKREAHCLISIGSVYFTLNETKKALDYYTQALKASQDMPDSAEVQYSLMNIASVYASLKDYDKALVYEVQGLKMAEKLHCKREVGQGLLNTAIIYTSQGNYNGALENIFKSRDIFKETANWRDLAVNYGNTGETYLAMYKDKIYTKKAGFTKSQEEDNLRKSIKYLNLGIAWCKKWMVYDALVEYYDSLSTAYACGHDYKKSMECYRKSVYYKDSVFSRKSAVAIDNAEARRLAVLKDREIIAQKLKNKESELKTSKAQIQSRNLWIYISSTTGILLFLVCGLFIYSINEKKRRFKIRHDIAKDLHADIGTGLSSITMNSEAVVKLIRQKKTQRAGEIVVKNIWNPASDMLTEIQDIIWVVNPNNDHLEHLIQRIKDKWSAICTSNGITLDLQIDEALNPVLLKMVQQKNIYLICREAINNAIKHSCCSVIHIKFSENSNGFSIIIKDDGKGFDALNVAGNGLKNIKKRCEELNIA
jgi:signal transduction histidine kinase